MPTGRASPSSNTPLTTDLLIFATVMGCRSSKLSFCLLVLIGYVNSIVNLEWKVGWRPADTSKTDLLATRGLAKLAAYQARDYAQSNCTFNNIAIRREWYATAPDQI